MNHLHLDDLPTLTYTNGLIPVVAQDRITGAVLMLAWANEEALRTSLETGAMTYFSRSRNGLWTKGETSGHTQKLIGLAYDCDRDAVLATVEQTGPACHTGASTCWDGGVPGWLGHLDELAADRKQSPKGGYTDSVLADPELAASKILEEAGEVAAVLRGLDNADTLEHEAADLLYHLIVALQGAGSNVDAVLRELAKR